MAIRDSGVRGEEGIKELTFPYQKRELKAAVVSGLSNAETLIQRIEAGEVHYDFVEVMACRRGCIMGGGQPVTQDSSIRSARIQGLYDTDINTQIKKSSENPLVMTAYERIIRGKEHLLLHRNFDAAKKAANADAESGTV